MELQLKLSPASITKIEAKKQRARRARHKGNRGEYFACEYLNTWLDVPEVFTPTNASGGSRLIGQPGDIVGPPNFVFCVEMKNDERWRFSDFFIAGLRRTQPAPIWQFWEQGKLACSKYNEKKRISQVAKYPALIFTRNYEEVFIMLQETTITYLNLKIPPTVAKLANAVEGYFIIMEFQNFLEANTPESLGIGV
jgi:hypothetical protein